MGISLLGISYDAHDASTIAQFWAGALHRSVNDGASADFASVAAAEDGQLGPFLMFHKVPEGKAVKNRVHFDLQTDEIEGEAARLIALGAKQIRALAENNGQWISFVDPEGNEFDLVAS